MNTHRLEYVVLTVRDIEATIHFYQSVMGMKKVVANDRHAVLALGQQKINLLEGDSKQQPETAQTDASNPDVRFMIQQPVMEAIEHLKGCDVNVIDGPVVRSEIMGKVVSAYFRDPDGNLIEVSNYIDELRWQ